MRGDELLFMQMLTLVMFVLGIIVGYWRGRWEEQDRHKQKGGIDGKR